MLDWLKIVWSIEGIQLSQLLPRGAYILGHSCTSIYLADNENHKLFMILIFYIIQKSLTGLEKWSNLCCISLCRFSVFLFYLSSWSSPVFRVYFWTFYSFEEEKWEKVCETVPRMARKKICLCRKWRQSINGWRKKVEKNNKVLKWQTIDKEPNVKKNQPDLHSQNLLFRIFIHFDARDFRGKWFWNSYFF